MSCFVYFPGGQDVHGKPDSEYVPSAHATHTFVFVSNSKPASHLEQPFLREFGAPEIPRFLQVSHDDEPNSNDTFAPGHILQAEDSDDPISGLNVPGAQSLQVDEESEPTAVENVPMPQFSQVVSFVAPGLILYFPATHEWHPVDIL